MNKGTIKLKGNLARYLYAPLRLGALLVLANILIYLLHWPSGLVLTGFLVLYFAVVLLLYFGNRATFFDEMVDFAAEYGTVQRDLLRELPIPYAVLDTQGRFVWMNQAFEKMTSLQKTDHRLVQVVFPDVTAEDLPTAEAPDKEVPLTRGDSYYTAQLHRIPMNALSGDSRIVEAPEGEEALVTMYLFDRTALELALQEIDNESLAVGFIYTDNYDEVMESTDEVKRPLLSAMIDRKVTRSIAAVDGLCTKIEKDRYLAVMRKRSLRQLEEKRFALLNEVKTVNVSNQMSPTVSIGMATDGLTYGQNLEYARNAIDLALGRGGDQAVVKTIRDTVYYGGKTQAVEKSTMVRARVKAQALKEILTSRSAVYIMGHRLPDIDSFGACIGIWRIANAMQKEAHIVLNETTTSLKPIVDLFRDNAEYPADMLLTSQQALDHLVPNSALVVVDVNRPSITECPELLHRSSAIVVLDHHRQGTEKIENATLSYIEGYASSTCEMVAEILQYTGEKFKLRPEEADAIYGGILIDTNNFSSKTGVRTFEAAAYLRRNGADMTRVRKLFREDVLEYKARADAVSQAEIYRGMFAISVCPHEGIASPTVIGAQAANELLNIKGVRGSFVLTQFQNQIYVSARSIDEVNVQVIMERLGGGGHMNIAGCQMEDVNIPEAIGILKKTIDAMMAEGEL